MAKTRIVLVGRGGSGKDYLRKRMIARGLTPSISYTSRPPREGEQEGVDYFYRSTIFFESNKDKFYELIVFNGWYYGTLREQFDNDDVFIMTPSGVNHIKPEDRNSCFIIYLNPPKEIIRERLEARNGMKDSVDRRMAADDADFLDFTDYDLMITNPYF